MKSRRNELMAISSWSAAEIWRLGYTKRRFTVAESLGFGLKLRIENKAKLIQSRGVG